jgi:hypothetical protein
MFNGGLKLQNEFYDVVLREMNAVSCGSKSPETAALDVLKEFSADRIYISSRFIRKNSLAEKVLKLKSLGVSKACIAERTGVTMRHVRRICAGLN